MPGQQPYIFIARNNDPFPDYEKLIRTETWGHNATLNSLVHKSDASSPSSALTAAALMNINTKQMFARLHTYVWGV